jgi:UV DNA damage endonuclease
MIKLGLVCISQTLRDENPDMVFKTMTRAQFCKKPRNTSILELSSRILHNLIVTVETIKQCHKIGIKHYRISCKLFPLLTEPNLKISLAEFLNQELIIAKLREIGETAKRLGVSLSCHPDQFVVLGSNSDEICAKSIQELNFHSWVLDTIGAPQDYTCPINIHPSLSKFESPEKFVDKFIKNFFQCDVGVRNRLVLENEDKAFWNAKNLYTYFHLYMKANYNFHFPLTLDNLHDQCNPAKNENGEIIPYKDHYLKFYATWPVTPVFHWSEGIENSSKHADELTIAPPDIGVDCIYECEVKAKDKGFLKFLPANNFS